MTATHSIPEPWRSFLMELDASLTQEVCLHCIGGFVVTLVYGLARPTADVDVLSILPVDERLPLLEQSRLGSALHQRHGIYLDCVTVATYPENYEERRGEIFPAGFQHIRLFALDPYDLALTKLTRNIQRDREDVRHLARQVPFDLETLQRRYPEELRPNLLGDPARHDLTMGLWTEMILEDRES